MTYFADDMNLGVEYTAGQGLVFTVDGLTVLQVEDGVDVLGMVAAALQGTTHGGHTGSD